MVEDNQVLMKAIVARGLAFLILALVGLLVFRVATGVVWVAASFTVIYELTSGAILILRSAQTRPAEAMGRHALSKTKRWGWAIASKALAFALILLPLTYLFVGGEGVSYWVEMILTRLVPPVLSYELLKIIISRLLNRQRNVTL